MDLIKTIWRYIVAAICTVKVWVDKLLKEIASAAAKRKAELEREAARRQAEQEREAARQKELASIMYRDTEHAIRSFFGNKLHVLKWTTGNIVLEDSVKSTDRWVTVRLKIKFTFSRALSSMTTREVEVFKYAWLLERFGYLDSDSFSKIKTGIIFNDGNCDISFHNYSVSQMYADKHGLSSRYAAAKHVLESFGYSTADKAITLFLTKFAEIEKLYPDYNIVQEFRGKAIGGSNWMSDHEVQSSCFSYNGTDSFFLGATDSGNVVWYGQEGSIVTIAPPGSGKTQCHVFPNLLWHEGPAIVLDVKGECYDNTGNWRRNNVGPVFKFNPLSPTDSASYNPLLYLENAPETLWEDCRLMAEQLIVPMDTRDPMWENRARDVLTGVLAWLVLEDDGSGKSKSMGKVIDVLSKIGWDEFVVDASRAVSISPLCRLGNSLAAMPEKQLEGILDTARRHLAIWEGHRVERVTATSDWTPEVLRDGSNSTIYICVSPNDIETYAPLLRVILAQHIRYLMKELPKQSSANSVLFMLDEMPRLGPMKPIEEALEVGRQYGIRLWMFIQSLGQLEKTYLNAEGMVGSCALRIFMNPSAHDGTAKRLSEELGYTESIIDNSRQLMVEPNVLAGPDYADYQIILARNTHPMKLKKVFAYNTPEIASRMTVSPGD